MSFFGKGGGSAPATPNPALAVAAQSAANKDAIRESAKISSIDQFGPQGSLTFTRDEDTGLPTAQIQSLTTDQQALLDAQENLGLDLLGAAGTQAGFLPTERFTLDGITDVNPTTIDFSQFTDARQGLPSNNIGVNQVGNNLTPFAGARTDPRQGTRDFAAPATDPRQALSAYNAPGSDFAGQGNSLAQANFDAELSLLQPDFDRDRERLVQQLTDQGFSAGNAAFDDEINRFERSKGETLSRLSNRSVAAGRAEQGRLFGQELAGAGQGLQFRGQQFGENIGAANQAFTQAAQQRQQQFGENIANRQQAFDETLAQRGTQLGEQQAARQSRFGEQQQTRSNLFNEQLANRQQGVSEALQNINLRGAARTRDINERLLERSQPFNEMSALIAGSPSVSQPQFAGTPQYNVAPPDVIGATFGAANLQNQAFANQQRNASSNLNGLFGLGGALGAAYLGKP